MPANALQIESRSFESFSAQRTSQGIQVSGQYKITIVNSGLLPVPSASYTLTSLSISDNVLVQDVTKNIGRLTSEAEVTVEFDKNVSSSTSKVQSVLESLCDGDAQDLKINEYASGILLAVVSDDKFSVQVNSSNCDLSRSSQPPDMGGGEDGGSNGGIGLEPPDDPEQPPEDDDGEQDDNDRPEPPDPVTVNIEGATDPLEDLDNTYDVEDEPDDVSRYEWEIFYTNSEGGSDTTENRTTTEDEITVVFDNPGYFEIDVETISSRDQVNGEGSISGRILDQFGGGDDSVDDTPPPQTNSGLRSMSQAVENKDNRGF